jgi:hypothetical protein
MTCKSVSETAERLRPEVISNIAYAEEFRHTETVCVHIPSPTPSGVHHTLNTSTSSVVEVSAEI